MQILQPFNCFCKIYELFMVIAVIHFFEDSYYTRKFFDLPYVLFDGSHQLVLKD